MFDLKTFCISISFWLIITGIVVSCNRSEIKVIDKIDEVSESNLFDIIGTGKLETTYKVSTQSTLKVISEQYRTEDISMYILKITGHDIYSVTLGYYDEPGKFNPGDTLALIKLSNIKHL